MNASCGSSGVVALFVMRSTRRPTRASSMRRLVSGDVQLTPVNRCGGYSNFCAASGAIVDDKITHWHRFCSSWKMLNLFFGVACQVNRKSTPREYPMLAAGRFGSGSYVHFVGSQAFLL